MYIMVLVKKESKISFEPPQALVLLFYQQKIIDRSEKTIWDLAVEERNRTENHSSKGISNLDAHCKCIPKLPLYEENSWVLN